MPNVLQPMQNVLQLMQGLLVATIRYLEGMRSSDDTICRLQWWISKFLENGDLEEFCRQVANRHQIIEFSILLSVLCIDIMKSSTKIFIFVRGNFRGQNNTIA